MDKRLEFKENKLFLMASNRAIKMHCYEFVNITSIMYCKHYISTLSTAISR